MDWRYKLSAIGENMEDLNYKTLKGERWTLRLNQTEQMLYDLLCKEYKRTRDWNDFQATTSEIVIQYAINRYSRKHNPKKPGIFEVYLDMTMRKSGLENTLHQS